MKRYIKEEEHNDVTEEYSVNGRRHREDGPAYIYERKGIVLAEEYYKDGKRHRDDGPAVISRRDDGSIQREEYWCEGKLDRTDGAAIILYTLDGITVASKEYWHGGEFEPVGVAERTDRLKSHRTR
jgi:hypothetical protein